MGIHGKRRKTGRKSLWEIVGNGRIPGMQAKKYIILKDIIFAKPLDIYGKIVYNNSRGRRFPEKSTKWR